MKYWYQKPEPLLADYIRTVLVLEGFSKPDPFALPLFSNGMPALVLKSILRSDNTQDIQQLALYGHSTSVDDWNISHDTTIIAWFFHPFALPCIFDLSAADLVNEPIELLEWKKDDATNIITRLLSAYSTRNKVEVINSFLQKQFRQQQRACELIRFATDQIRLHPDPNVLVDLLQKLELNERILQRLFKKYVGVTPNQYRQICQFQASFTELTTHQSTQPLDPFYNKHFADEGRLARSLHDFTQMTPGDYSRWGLSSGQN